MRVGFVQRALVIPGRALKEREGKGTQASTFAQHRNLDPLDLAFSPSAQMLAGDDRKA